MKNKLRKLQSLSANDTTATATLNANFEQIEKEILNTLSRDGTQPNYMDADIDLNNHKIINIAEPVDDGDLVTKKYVDENIGNAYGYSLDAAQSANRAASSAQQAATSASSALANANYCHTVADDILNDENIQGLAADLASEDSVVKAVEAIQEDVTTVAGIASDVSAVADSAADISTVSDDLTNIDTVAGSITDVSTVAEIASSIATVADNTTNINAVADIDDDITTVASIDDDITTVAGISSDVSAVADDISDVSAVAADLTNINAVAADLENIDNASTYADNAEIWAEGTDEEVQALGGVHSSKGWANQSAQGQVQSDWEESNPTSKAYIQNKPTIPTTTNSVTSGSTEALTSGGAYTALQGYANTSLSNLSSAGQLIVDTHNGTISNCVLNIPQNINVELSNGKFTLKAGSKVYVPNGVGDFEEIVFAQDASVTPSVFSTSTNRLVVYSPLVNTITMVDCTMSYISSGTTTPTSFDGNGRAFWYDTTNNLLKRTGDSGSTWVDGFSFPIALVDITNGTGVTNIRQIFNGAGYIGHHAFIVPNVKALLADGLNSDGNYKSINYTASTLQTIELSANSVFVAVRTTTLSQDIQERYIISEIEPENPVNNTVWYNPVTNLMQQRVSGSWVKVNKAYLIKCTYDGTSVTNFEIFQSVKVATIDMLDKVQGQVDTNTSNIANKQDTLVSGTSIKTINSTSLLGSGNISLLTGADIANMQTTTNLVTSVSSASTDSQYPSAKLFYDTCGDIETLINAL